MGICGGGVLARLTFEQNISLTIKTIFPTAAALRGIQCPSSTLPQPPLHLHYHIKAPSSERDFSFKNGSKASGGREGGEDKTAVAGKGPSSSSLLSAYERKRERDGGRQIETVENRCKDYWSGVQSCAVEEAAFFNSHSSGRRWKRRGVLELQER